MTSQNYISTPQIRCVLHSLGYCLLCDHIQPCFGVTRLHRHVHSFLVLCSCISYQKKVSHCTCSQTICHKALFLLKRTCLDGKGRHITNFEHHATSSASNTPRHEFLVVYPRIKIERERGGLYFSSPLLSTLSIYG